MAHATPSVSATGPCGPTAMPQPFGAMRAAEETATTGATTAPCRGASKRGVPAHDTTVPTGPTTRGMAKRAKQTAADSVETAATKTTPLIEHLRSLGADFLDQMEAAGGHNGHRI